MPGGKNLPANTASTIQYKTNRFKGLHLIERVPEELRMEVHDTVQETDQDHPREKEMLKGKMAVWGGLTSSWEKKRRERQRRKGKIYPFECRFPKKAFGNKAFLSDQCKEIEEKNRMGKTRDLFKKIRHTKGTFHAKMGTIKDRNGMDLIEAEVLKRGGKNTLKNYTKKIFMTQIATMVWSLT